jgi:hypothetical protein
MGSIIRFHDEKRLTLSPRYCAGQPGAYPYYGPRGIIARIDSYAYEGEYLLVAESPRIAKGGPDAALAARTAAPFGTASPMAAPSTPSGTIPAVPPALAVPVSGRFSAAAQVHVLSCDRETEPRFLCRLLNAIPRTALPRSLGQENLAALEILLPPPEDQRQILTAVLNIERKMTLLHDQNRVLRGMIQAMFDRYFIFGGGSPRPLGDFAEYRNLDSGSGRRPRPGEDRPGPSPVPNPAAAPPAAQAAPTVPTARAATAVTTTAAGTAFHNLFLCPRGDLHPLFTGALVTSSEFLAYAETCREHRGGKQRLNGELLMAFELTGPARHPEGTPFPSGCYREFNQAAGAAEKKLAANRAELGVLEQLRQSLFPPHEGS